MMSYKIGKRQSYIAYMIKDSGKLIVCSLFLFCFLFILYTVSNCNGIYYYGHRYCLADAYVWFLKPRAYGILIAPLVLILFINFTKYDQMPSLLIRLGTIASLVKRKVTVAIVFSLVVTITALVIITLITSLQVTTIINWDREHSVYYAMTHRTNENVRIGHVILMAFITILIRNIFLCLCSILISLKFNNNIFTFILITSVTICEALQKYVPLFYNFISIDYIFWEKKELIFLYASYCIAMFFVMSTTIIRCSKKREWLNEE